MIVLQSIPGSEWRRYTWQPPFTGVSYASGHRLVIAGDIVRREHDGILVDVRGPAAYVVVEGEVAPLVEPAGQYSELFVEVRLNMAAVNAVLTNVTLGVDGETYTLTLDDGSGHPFTAEQMATARTELQSTDHLVKYLAADLITRQPSLENMDACNGTMVTYNAAAQQPFVIARNE